MRKAFLLILFPFIFNFFAKADYLIPRNFLEDPVVVKKFTKGETQERFGKDLFGQCWAIAVFDLPLESDTANIMIATDYCWSRLLWTMRGVNKIYAYGSYGSGSSQFKNPKGIDIYPPDVFIADENNHRIVHLRVQSEGNDVTGISWIKSFGAGHLIKPIDIAYSDNGTSDVSDDIIYVADLKANAIKKFRRSGTYLSSFQGIGFGLGEINSPIAVTLGESNGYNTKDIYVSNFGCRQLVAYGDYPRGASDFYYRKLDLPPQDLVLSLKCDKFGSVYAAATSTNQIIKYSSKLSSCLWRYGSEGEFFNLQSIFIDNDELYAVERWDDFSGISRYWIADFHPPDTIPPVAIIHSPPSLTYINHIIYIVATATDNRCVNDWQVWYAKGINPEEGWVLVGFGTSSKKEEVISEWDTYELEEGIYTLKLLVHDDSGNETEANIVVHVGEPPLELIIGKMGHGDEELRLPTDVSVDTSGLIYISDTQNDRIQVFEASGDFLYKWGKHGKEINEFKQPSFSMISENRIHIADTYNNRYQIFTLLGYYLSSIGNKGHQPGGFNKTGGVDLHNNYFYLADIHHHQIHKYSKDGIYKSSFGEYGSEPGQLNQPHGLTIIDTFIYIADKQNNRVQKFTISGTLKKVIGTEGSEDGQFSHPIDIVVDSDSCFYVTDYHNNRFQKFDKYGYRLLTVYSEDDSLKMPSGVGIDRFMNTYVTDTHNNRVLKFPQKLDIDEESITMTPPPENATLLPSYPNPFTKIVMIQYGVPKKDQIGHTSQGLLSGGQNGPQGPSITGQHRVILKIYDQIGRLVKTIVDEEKTPGWFRAVWSGEDNIGRKVSSGVYFLRLQIDTEIKTQKVVIVK